MKTLRIIWLRIRSLWQRLAVKQEIDEELRFHIEQRTVENIAAGMSPEEAAHEARKRFGNMQTVREESREARGANSGEAIVQDVRFAARMMRKNVGSTLVVVLTLGLVFDLVNARILAGRRFTAADMTSGAGVVLINETLARRYFAGEAPLGRFIEMRVFGSEPRSFQIIGVVPDLKNIAFKEEPFAELFVPYSQAVHYWLSHYFMVRTATDPRTMAEPLRDAILSINRNQPVGNVVTIQSQILQLRQWNSVLCKRPYPSSNLRISKRYS